MISINFSNYKNILIKNEDKIILAIGFILVAVLSFGAGKLSEVYRAQTPIVFQDNPNCAKNQALTNETANKTAENQNKDMISETQGQIIGNKNSKIYHLPGGSSYNKVSAENRVYFTTEEEAQKAGYRKAKN